MNVLHELSNSVLIHPIAILQMWILKPKEGVNGRTRIWKQIFPILKLMFLTTA